MKDILERGKRERVAHIVHDDEMQRHNLEKGQAEVRRSFVFSFYHETMVDTNLSGAYHKFGPESPSPKIRVARGEKLGSLGGAYHYVDWKFEWEGIRWLARWSFGLEAWSLNFYVRKNGRWILVHSPSWVYEVFA